VRMHPLSELDQVINAAKQLNPALNEGFVVCDSRFGRIKIKSPAYVAIAGLTLHDKNKTNKRRMLEVVMTNEGSEFLSYFPEWAGPYRLISAKYSEFCIRVEQTHEKIALELEERAAAGQKASYTIAIEQFPYKEYIRAVKEGNNIREYLATRPVKQVEEFMISEGLLEDIKYLPSWPEESFTTFTTTSQTIETAKEDEQVVERGNSRKRGRRKKTKQEEQEEQTLQAMAYNRRPRNKSKPSKKNASQKNERRRR